MRGQASYTSVLVYWCTGIQAYWYTGIRIYHPGTLVYWCIDPYIGMRVYQYTGIWYTSIPLYRYPGLTVYRGILAPVQVQGNCS